MDTANRWILEMSAFENGFTFDAQAAGVLLTLALIAAGLLLTYVGQRAVKAAMLLAAAALCGWAGVMLVNQLTAANALLEMVFFITMAFFGICGFYFLSVLWNGLWGSLGIHGCLERRLWPVSPVLGGAALGAVVWLRIYRWTPLAAVLAVVFAVTGLLVQGRSRHRRRAFHTYEEIYHRKQKEGAVCAGGEP